MTRYDNNIVIPEKPQALSGIHRRFAAIAAVAALLAAPQAALANPGGLCGAQTTDGVSGTADTITCDPNESYPDGITYTSDGDLTLEVLPNDPVNLDVAEVGVDVTSGDAGDNLFWDSSDFTAGDITGTDVVLDYLSDTGNVEILVGGGVVGTGDATHAIRAESTGGGSVSVTTLGDIHGAFGGGASGIGIEALTTSGDITINSSARVNSGLAGGAYAIHADSSAGGSITITADGNVRGSSSAATHGILAETTGTGTVNITTNGQTSASGPGGTGIEATSGGGDIVVNVLADNFSDMVIGDNGLIAETGGEGTIDLDIAAVRSGGTGISAITGTGAITIDLGGAIMSGGTAVVTQTDGLATVNLASEIRGLGLQSFGADTAISASGGSIVVNVSGTVGGGLKDSGISRIMAPFDFSGLSGGAEVNFDPASAWIVTDPNGLGGLGRSVFSPADDLVNIAEGAWLATPLVGSSFVAVTNPPSTAEEGRFIADFGDGEDVIDNAGDVYVGPVISTVALSIQSGYSAEMRLDGLTEFRNSGTIWLGKSLEEGEGTDLWPDDIFAVPGATFHGEPGSRVVMDADLNQVVQESCTPAARQPGLDEFGRELADLAADCINIENGSATGRTLLVIQQMIPGDRGAYNPEGLVLVDLNGGDPDATDPDAFGISPDSPQYSSAQGGIIDKGLFFYSLSFDPADQRFKLYGLPAAGAQQLPLLGHAANQLWRTSAGAWFDRTVDQRDIDRDDLGGSLWFRGSRHSGDRDAINLIQAGGETLEFNNSYTQDDTTATLGGDFISRSSSNSAWVIGAMLGYARAKVDFDDYPNIANIEGMHAGLYGSFVQGGFYVDAAINRTWLETDFDVPSLELEPATTVLGSEINSFGGQIEAGWRWQMGRLMVEPLAGLSYVQSNIDDIRVPADDPTRFGAEIEFDDPTSTRGSLGLRLRMDDVAPGVVPVSVGLTAKAIEEFDGESHANIVNVGPLDAPVTDTLDGTFGQVTGDVSVTNAAKTMAGFLKVDGMFHDDYESLGVSVGFRAQW